MLYSCVFLGVSGEGVEVGISKEVQKKTTAIRFVKERLSELRAEERRRVCAHVYVMEFIYLYIVPDSWTATLQRFCCIEV